MQLQPYRCGWWWWWFQCGEQRHSESARRRFNSTVGMGRVQQSQPKVRKQKETKNCEKPPPKVTNCQTLRTLFARYIPQSPRFRCPHIRWWGSACSTASVLARCENPDKRPPRQSSPQTTLKRRKKMVTCCAASAMHNHPLCGSGL